MANKCKDIELFMEDTAPRVLAEEHDNNGFLIGDIEKDVDSVVVCLDIEPETVELAIQKKSGMIISHHPLIYRPMASLTLDDPKARIIFTLAKNDICVYAAHTNLDAAEDGVAVALAERLGLIELSALASRHGDDTPLRFGRMGMLGIPMKKDDFLCMTMAKLDVRSFKTIGSINRPIQKVMVFPGSFSCDIRDIVRYEPDALITGEIKYHDALELKQRGLFAIVAGHYDTEKFVIHKLAQMLKNRFAGMEVVEYSSTGTLVDFYGASS